MLGSYDLVAFVLTSDPARAKRFYGDTLGLKFVGQDDYAVVFDANGVMIRVTIIPGHTPAQHTVLGWNVPDIVVAAADLLKAGVKFEKYSFLEQDDLAKVAWFKDLEGNVLSISQH
ncbi:MAG TPA: VOC family protein [Bryobacteraceae bacterium]|nr:VOC family protein [Bryobacteraceae bacterium]